ncbi:MAG: hypothetical protein ACTHLR_13605 [Rhizomicrobium sp.]
MSQPRFAPVTAELLARKGGATPSAMSPARVEFVRPVAPPRHEEPRIDHDPDAEAHPLQDPSRPKKLFVPMTHREHEQLAIVAVKTGLTRHQIVRDALEIYIEQLALDMGDDCPCITSGFGCRSGCGFG